ncbi:hypothetical protein QBC45DRAFT_388416 [Copromyces sp. CBS 386.78]|nr:hypothetical protein QBC45DRAFT_388416 [Copromyces sp. CBS 386.78]
MPILSSILSKLVWADGQPPQAPQQPSTTPAPAAPTTVTTTTQTPVPAPADASSLAPTSDAARYPPAEQWEERPYPPVFSERSMKQLGLFFGGATFFALSVAVSRRAVARHLKASKMEIFAPNPMALGISRPSAGNINAKGDGHPLMAAEALTLATLNVVSFATMAAGGTSWALDISSVEDLRRKARRTLYGGNGANLDEEAEKEVAEWVAKTLGIDLEKAEEEEAKGKMLNEEAVKKP